MKDKKKLLKEYFDSVQDENVKKFMGQCIETIPEYWFVVPASSTGKHHPNYALGKGGLMRHTIAMLRFFNHLVYNNMYGRVFTDREMDLLRVACLMHDTRKSGSDAEFAVDKHTKFNHPILAADAVRSIKTKYITDEEKEIIANAIESHMGQWNTDTHENSNVTLPLPTNKYQKIVHLVDYLAAQKGVEVIFDGFTDENNDVENVNDCDEIEHEPENYKQQVLSEMSNLVKDYIRQKSVKWSEEDERTRKDIIQVLKGEIRYISGKENEKYINWLNSLKERMRKDYGK